METNFMIKNYWIYVVNADSNFLLKYKSVIYYSNKLIMSIYVLQQILYLLLPPLYYQLDQRKYVQTIYSNTDNIHLHMQSSNNNNNNGIQSQNMHHPNVQLSASQAQLILNAQSFVRTNNPESEKALKQSSWRDMYVVISHPHLDNNIRIVCCSVLKWLIYHQKFVDNPMELFNSLCEFYMTNFNSANSIMNNSNNSLNKTNSISQMYRLTKPQQLVQIVIKVIPSNYLNSKQKQLLIAQFIKNLYVDLFKSTRIIKLLKIIIQEMEVESINNQVIVGEILLYLQRVIKQPNPQPNNSNSIYLKLLVIEQCIGLIQHIIDIVNNEDQIDSNSVQQFLFNSSLAKNILWQIISDGSNGVQIISTNTQINKCKFIALELYSSIWIYYLEQKMFRLCLSSLLSKPHNQLIDHQGDIMQKIVIMLQRSINQQAYYTFFHKNLQQIIIALLSLLKPKESYLTLLEQQPQRFVQMLSDFCMQQQQQQLQTKVGSLLSSLCLYIDGYMSFIGSMCIMVIKNFNNTIKQIPTAEQYINTINLLWTCSDEQKVATCILVLCSLSDQFQKRQDMLRPLKLQLFNMTPMFKYPDCKLPPYLICRFMYLYSFYAFPKCLDVFLPYKGVKRVYQYQLQNCYTTMCRYYSRYPQCKRYIDEIGHIAIISDHLTPLLQSSIMNAQMTPKLQFQIMQKLVLWMEQGVKNRSNIVCNKIANLITILIDRLVVQDYKQMQDAVFAYIQPIIKTMLKEQGRESEQFVIEICVAYVKRFPSLSLSSPQQSGSKQKLMFLIDMGFKVVQRNNGNLNICLDLFFQITKYLSYDLLISLIQIYLGCLASQHREEDHWECYYGLENCMLKLCELKVNKVPIINVSFILQKMKNYRSNVLIIKVYMFIYSLILADTQRSNNIDYNLILNFNIDPDNDIVPYQNKPYCLYLMNIASVVSIPLQSSQKYIELILKLIKREKNIGQRIKNYEQDIYTNIYQNNQIITNSYTLSRKLLHPLIIKNIDIYNQFRKFWLAFPHRDVLIKNFNRETINYVTELCTQTTINQRVRRIYKVKKQTIPTEAGNQPQRSNSSMGDQNRNNQSQMS